MVTTYTETPKANADQSGFLPVERTWIDKFIGHGYADTFRKFFPDEPAHRGANPDRAGAYRSGNRFMVQNPCRQSHAGYPVFVI